MSDVVIYTVRLEPVGLEMEVEEGETVLDAAFRQGIALMHGCKEGQCGSCKSRLISGDIELLKYSTFALPDYERETEHILLCKTHAYSDLEVELLNFDEDLLARAIPVKEYEARLTKITALTHDIRCPGGRSRQAPEILGRTICRPDDPRSRGHSRLFHGQCAGRGHASFVHHQEVFRRRFFGAA